MQPRAGGFSYDVWEEEEVKKKNARPEMVRKYHRVEIELEGVGKDAVLVANVNRREEKVYRSLKKIIAGSKNCRINNRNTGRW